MVARPARAQPRRSPKTVLPRAISKAASRHGRPRMESSITSRPMPRHGEVRRALHLVQGRKGGSAHVESASLSLKSVLLLALAMASPLAHAADQPALELVATIPMPGVKGRIDHFAADLKRHRLFVAALGNNTVEVLDVAGNRHEKSVAGFGEPQGMVNLPRSNRLFVAIGSANRVDILEAASLSVVKRLEQLDDADNLRYDAAAGKVVVGYGKGALRFMDADSGDSAAEVRLAGHPESF